MSAFTRADLDEIYVFALALGKDAGTLLNDSMLARCSGNTPSGHVEKESAVDLVTQTDYGKQSLCFHMIHQDIGGV